MALNSKIADWRHKRVWLVGASSGIGLATASLLHARGAQVIVSARNQKALQTFVAAHPGSLALPLDVTDPQACRAATDAAWHEGPIDLLCYCAGTYQPLRATDWLQSASRHQEALHTQWQVNYLGALQVLDAYVPKLLHTVTTQSQPSNYQPHISLVSSIAGLRGLPQGLAYGPSKAALTHLAETLYLDLHDLGIGVSVVTPGFVDTPLTAQNTFSMPALMPVDAAAQALVQGWQRGQFDIHFPKRFTHVLRFLRLLPYRLYFAAVRRFTGL